MPITRREIIAALVAIPAIAIGADQTINKEKQSMYGLITKMRSVPNQRDALATILVAGTVGMPGCLSYIVAKDSVDPDALWITEAWDSQASHKASLALPSVKQTIALGRPLIAGFGERFETQPFGGHGVVSLN